MPADQFDDDIDIGIIDHRIRIGGEVDIFHAARHFLGARASVRVATRVMRIGRPARRVISSSLRRSTVHVPRPTVPMPSNPTCNGFMEVWAILVRSEQAVVAKHLLDAADRLPGPAFVLDHGKAHVPVAELAEADAGRDGHLGLRDAVSW